MTEQHTPKMSVEINGRQYDAQAGQTIIQVADKNSVYIPRFCYHDKLSVVANCRMCLVEVANAPKTMPACATPVSDGMKVMTSSPKALSAQRAVMSFLLINHPLDCPVCDQGGACELQDLSMGFGRGTSEFTLPKRAVADKNIGPLVKTHMTRCIHCTRCVRFGEEIAGMRELGATGRGEHMEIGTYVSKMMASELSGNAIDICPVGALTSKPFAFSARHWEMTQHAGVSPHDAVGSSLYLHTRGDAYHAGRTVMKVIPRFQPDLNENWLSDRDRFSYTGLASPQRLLAPEIKQHGVWHKVSWTVAMKHVASEIIKVIATAGPSEVAGLASAQATTEALYSFQTWLRGLGCAHIDFRAQQQDFSDDAQLPVAPTGGGDMASIERSDLVLLVGSCVRQEQPMLNHRVRKAVLRGAKVMSMQMAPYQANYDIAHTVTVGIEDMVHALAYWVAQLLGDRMPKACLAYCREAPQQETLQAMSHVWQRAKHPVVLFGADACHHPHAAVLRQLLLCLQQHQSYRLLVLAIGPNVAGACVAGVLPHRDVAGHRLSQAGDHALAMMQSPKQAYVLLNHEPEWDHAQPEVALSALKQAGAVVSCTSFVTDTMRDYSTVLLPIAPFGFEDGSYVNMMGEWQGVTALPSEHTGVQQAWRVFKSLAAVMSVAGLDFKSSTDIRSHLQAQNEPSDAAAEQRWEWPAVATETPPQEACLRCIVRTHMYQIDPLVRRATPLQQVAEVVLNTVFLNPQDEQSLALQSGDTVTVQHADQCLSMVYQSSTEVPAGCVLMYRQQAARCAATHGGWLQVIKGQRDAN